jgi:hypothetical protein
MGERRDMAYFDRSRVGLFVLRGDDRVRNFLCILTVWNTGFDLSTCAGERPDTQISNLKIGGNLSNKKKYRFIAKGKRPKRAQVDENAMSKRSIVV